MCAILCHLPVFFIDRSLGGVDVPEALRKAGYDCVLGDDEFAQGAADDYWPPAVGHKQWIVVTKDEKIRYRPLELQALRDANVCAFIVISGNVTGAKMAEIIVSAMPRILNAIRSYKKPYICYVYKSGKVQRDHQYHLVKEAP
jgi:PIN like domain